MLFEDDEYYNPDTSPKIKFTEIKPVNTEPKTKCEICRNKRYFEPSFSTGWVCCRRMTPSKDDFCVELSSIPLAIRENCPGFEKRSILNILKKKKNRIIYEEC